MFGSSQQMLWIEDFFWHIQNVYLSGYSNNGAYYLFHCSGVQIRCFSQQVKRPYAFGLGYTWFAKGSSARNYSFVKLTEVLIQLCGNFLSLYVLNSYLTKHPSIPVSGLYLSIVCSSLLMHFVLEFNVVIFGTVPPRNIPAHLVTNAPAILAYIYLFGTQLPHIALASHILKCPVQDQF